MRFLGEQLHPMEVTASTGVKITVRLGILSFLLFYLLIIRLLVRTETSARQLQEIRRVVHET